MTPHVDVSARNVLSALALALLFEPSACTPQSPSASASGNDAGRDVPLNRDGASDQSPAGTGGAASGGMLGSGGSTGSGGALPGAGGSAGMDGGSGIDGGAGARGGTSGTDGGGGISGTGGLLGIGGMAPYTTGAPRTQAGSFACPRFMIFSPEMNQAAVDDATANGWPIGSFNYGVATLNGAPCCSCWQLVFSTPENKDFSYKPPKPIIIQMFNTGGNDGAFDIFMGKGGLGNFTNVCPNMYATFPKTGEAWGGGITAKNIDACGKTSETLASSACVQAITTACNEIVGKNDYVTQATRNSCVVGNMEGSFYHLNWNIKGKMVECPEALTKVTGCRLNPGKDPKPDPAIQTAAQAAAAGWKDYKTTTMQDCCSGHCTWPTNVGGNTQKPWTNLYQCDAQGNVFVAK